MLATTRIAGHSKFLALAALTFGCMLAVASAGADEGATPPNPPNDSPPSGNRQQWQECRKQADAQKLPRGDARREFMRNCIKSAKAAPAQPA